MSARRRALLILVVALVLAAASWLAAALLGGSEIDVRTGDGAGFTVRTAFPAAWCEKELTGEFPWVRFSCEPREDAAPNALDTLGTGE